MKAWGFLAIATFKEGVRNKVFYNLFFFGLLIIAASLILNQMTVGDAGKIIKDLGLSCINIFGLLIAVFVGTNLVYREFEDEIIFHLLTKPISREGYLLGKFLGVMGLIVINGLIMAIATSSFLLAVEGKFFWPIFKAVYLILLELSLIFALTLFFSTFMRPQVSIFSVLVIFVIGHSTTEVRTLIGSKGDYLSKLMADMAYYIFPNFDHFDIKTQVVHNLPLLPFHLLWTTFYGMCYTALLLLFAGIIFKKKEF